MQWGCKKDVFLCCHVWDFIKKKFTCGYSSMQLCANPKILQNQWSKMLLLFLMFGFSGFISPAEGAYIYIYVDCIPYNLIHMYKMHVPTVALWLKGGINHDPTWLRSATCGKGCVPHFVAVNFVCHCLATWVGVPDLLTLVAERFVHLLG